MDTTKELLEASLPCAGATAVDVAGDGEVDEDEDDDVEREVFFLDPAVKNSGARGCGTRGGGGGGGHPINVLRASAVDRMRWGWRGKTADSDGDEDVAEEEDRRNRRRFSIESEDEVAVVPVPVPTGKTAARKAEVAVPVRTPLKEVNGTPEVNRIQHAPPSPVPSPRKLARPPDGVAPPSSFPTSSSADKGLPPTPKKRTVFDDSPCGGGGGGDDDVRILDVHDDQMFDDPVFTDYKGEELSFLAKDIETSWRRELAAEPRRRILAGRLSPLIVSKASPGPAKHLLSPSLALRVRAAAASAKAAASPVPVSAATESGPDGDRSHLDLAEFEELERLLRSPPVMAAAAQQNLAEVHRGGDRGPEEEPQVPPCSERPSTHPAGQPSGSSSLLSTPGAADEDDGEDGGDASTCSDWFDTTREEMILYERFGEDYDVIVGKMSRSDKERLKAEVSRAIPKDPRELLGLDHSSGDDEQVSSPPRSGLASCHPSEQSLPGLKDARRLGPTFEGNGPILTDSSGTRSGKVRTGGGDDWGKGDSPASGLTRYLDTLHQGLLTAPTSSLGRVEEGHANDLGRSFRCPLPSTPTASLKVVTPSYRRSTAASRLRASPRKGLLTPAQVTGIQTPVRLPSSVTTRQKKTLKKPLLDLDRIASPVGMYIHSSPAQFITQIRPHKGISSASPRKGQPEAPHQLTEDTEDSKRKKRAFKPLPMAEYSPSGKAIFERRADDLVVGSPQGQETLPRTFRNVDLVQAVVVKHLGKVKGSQSDEQQVVDVSMREVTEQHRSVVLPQMRSHGLAAAAAKGAKISPTRQC